MHTILLCCESRIIARITVVLPIAIISGQVFVSGCSGDFRVRIWSSEGNLLQSMNGGHCRLI